MTFDLKVITIETKPRAGYYIFHEGDFSTVKKVVPQRSEVHLNNGIILPLAEASKKVAKLIGEVTTEQEDKVITKTYSIVMVILMVSFVGFMIIFPMEMMYPKRIENIRLLKML